MKNELQIKLTDFEGPLDLLLHLIKTSAMDIYDIPIVEITTQYTDFLHQNKNDLDVAGEYLVMAATLMKIKSQYLLPIRPNIDIDNGDEIYEDPRQELMDQLIEYHKYKNVANELKQLEERRKQQFNRMPASLPKDINTNIISPGTTINDLENAFLNLLKNKSQNKEIFTTIQKETFTINQKSVHIREKLALNPHGIFFNSLFEYKKQINTDEYVTTFLAILEMTKNNELIITQSEMGEDLLIQSLKDKD